MFFFFDIQTIGVKRFDIINRLVKEMGYQRYLEVGVADGASWRRVEVDKKVGVDPTTKISGIIKAGSDEFFAHNTHNFDLVFVDGDHRWPQTLRDVLNALKVLEPQGTILMHDCMALNPARATAKFTPKWNGTVWRAFTILRMTRPDLTMFTIREDHGIGVVRPGTQKVYEMDSRDELTHQYYRSHMDEILLLKGIDEFFGDVVPSWK